MTAILPSRSFFLYLNIDVFPAAWAAYRGVLVTSSNYGTEAFRPLSYWPLGLLKKKDTVRLQKELRLEEIRRDFYPQQVSRLHGIYLWGDSVSAERGQERWGQEAGTHFHRDYLVEIGFTYTKITKVDTTWIDMYLLPDSVLLDKTNEDWMHRYWRSEPYPNAEPLWEFIVEGRGAIWGTRPRMKAYEIVKSQAPLSLGQLEVSRIAVELKSDLYNIAPFIQRVGQTGFRVDYFLDNHDENDAFMEKIGGYINSIAEKDPSKIDLSAINMLRDTSYKPKLPGFEFDSAEFSIDAEIIAQAIISKHDGSSWHGME